MSSLVQDWAAYVMSDLGMEELQNLLDEADAEAIAGALNPIGILALTMVKGNDLEGILRSVFIAGIHWARYRAEHERGEVMEKMLKKVKGL